MDNDATVEMTSFQLRVMLTAAWLRGTEYGKQCDIMDKMISANKHIVDREIDAHTLKDR